MMIIIVLLWCIIYIYIYVIQNCKSYSISINDDTLPTPWDLNGETGNYDQRSGDSGSCRKLVISLRLHFQKLVSAVPYVSCLYISMLHSSWISLLWTSIDHIYIHVYHIIIYNYIDGWTYSSVNFSRKCLVGSQLVQIHSGTAVATAQ